MQQPIRMNMQNNSQNTNDFKAYLDKEKAKDPTLQIIRNEDLVPMNDPSCKHEMLHLDESEKDFDCLICNNPKCGQGWLFPLGTIRNKLKKEE